MWVANKNLVHNGKEYAKGDEVKEGAEGFKDLKQAGHLSESSDKKPSAPPSEETASEDRPSEKKSRK